MLHGCNYTGVILPRQWHKRKGDLGFGAAYETFGIRKKPLTCENGPVSLGFANFPGRKKLTKNFPKRRKRLRATRDFSRLDALEAFLVCCSKSRPTRSRPGSLGW